MNLVENLWVEMEIEEYLRKPFLLEEPRTKCSIADWEVYSIKALDTSPCSTTTSLQCTYQINKKRKNRKEIIAKL